MRRTLTRIVATSALALTATAAPASATPARCTAVSVPVPLTASAPPTLRVSATLCAPRGATTVHVLVPGGTYGQAYWWLRGDPARPSYVEAALARGSATLVLDRLGAGASSAPPSTGYAPDTQEAVLGEVLRRVRTGLAGHRFGTVVAVGHSYGSTLARTLAIHQPGSVDALLLTGEAAFAAELPWDQVVHPVTEDPLLRRRGLDEGYYTTRPGARSRWFYDLSTTDRRVLLLDELTKQPDVYSSSYPAPEENAAIGVPTLIVVGQQDRVVCGGIGSDCTSSAALLAQERRHYRTADLAAWVVPATGHSLNLHRTAPQWQTRALDWLDAHTR
ncbi:alpha/beta hydrolase [Actinokineospora sp. PR83]|uniref:alpha/beta fold hydrolase n=1 Tax=Actinokineospora sp. PR83 TaxID=2884908 RepID=UPI0027DF7F89|nr:alpha/beta hydrolase [Actinokineospora sp. PR83]MCG8920589.1 alpha/beta hydrolase [Actinokineospora sp. PR83]